VRPQGWLYASCGGEVVTVEVAILTVLALVVWGLFSRTAQTKGRRGEKKVSSGLSRSLNGTDYQIIDDVTLSTGNATTQIDHLVVSPYGVFVVETKNMSGWIFGGADHAHWTQVLFKLKHKFQNPIKQNYRHVKAVQSLFGLRPYQVHSVVVFIDTCVFKTEMPPGVAKGVPQLIEFILLREARVVTDEEIEHLIEDIQAKRLSPGRRTDRAHIRNIKKIARNERSSTVCPRCGNSLVERTNKSTGERFLGCKRYPRCKGTRPVP
jgi:restriction system protein